MTKEIHEYTLWGVKKGQPDYMEDLLSVKRENFDKVKEMASRHGYDRFRVSKIDMREKPDFTKAIKKDDGGAINQSINTNIMNNHKFNQLPHINTIREGDDVIIEESVFVGGERPKHVGERYIHCKVMGMGGMVDSLNLEVVKSVGFNPFEQGRMITRPIKNVLQRGRRLIVEPIADAIPSKMGLDDLFVGDEVSYKGNSYKVGGMTDCHNYVKANNIKSGVDEEIDVDDLMSNSTLIKRKK